MPITIRSVTLRYGSLMVLDRVSLDIASGEFITLLGPSGSGKTTLLMILAGFVRPEAGSLRFGERDITLLASHKRGIGVVFQNYALFPHMSVGGNIAYPLRLRRVPTREAQERVKRALALVQLEGLQDRRVDQLSGGQRQRVALARAIVFEPPVLLMDEPLSALDKKLREQMQTEIRALHEKLGTTTIYVTHDQREALTMSDRIVVLNHGQIAQVGRPDEIYERPRTQFVADFIGECHFLPVTLRDGVPYFADQAVRLAEPVRDRQTTRQLMAIRPEKLRILNDGAEPQLNCFRGTVDRFVYQGESALVHVVLADGSRVAVRHLVGGGSQNLAPQKADPIWLGLDPRDGILVAPEAER